MRRLMEHQVAVRAFGALIYSFNTQPRHFGVGAFLFVAIASLLVWSAKPLMRGVPLARNLSKSHIGRFVLHIPLKEGEAIASEAQGGVVLHKVNLMHPAKSFSLSR